MNKWIGKKLGMRIFFILLLTFAWTIGFSQSEKPLAVIGDQTISEEDFKIKWETTPQPGREQDGPMTESKEMLLKTMVAEKILAAHAREQGLDTLWTIQRLRKSMEEICMRDQLFKSEIDSKVKITPEMTAEAKRRAAFIYQVRFVFHPDKDSALFLYSILNLGADFDSILANRPERMEQPEPLKLTFGTMEQPVEDAIFAVNSVGKYTKPVQRPEGWFVFKVLSMEKAPVVSEKEETAKNRQIRDMVYLRETNRYQEEFMRRFFADKKVSTDGKLFKILTAHLINRLAPQIREQNPKKITPVTITDAELLRLEREFGSDTLNMPYIKYSPSPVSLRDFLYDLQFRGWKVSSSDPEKIQASFRSINEIMARDAVLNHEARLRGLDKHPEVVKRVSEYMDYWLAERIKGRLSTSVSVSEAEAKEFYEKITAKLADSVLINTIEIQVSEFETTREIMEQFSSGQSMQNLFKLFNENLNLTHPQGETGWFLPSQRGSVGRDLSKLNLFETFGPVKTGMYYSIFQLIGKKKIGGIEKPEIEPFETIKDQVLESAKEYKYLQELNKLTAGLATRYQVQVNLAALKTVKVSTVNMAAFQEMGFGGKVLYVPYTSNFDTWFEEWKKQPVNP